MSDGEEKKKCKPVGFLAFKCVRNCFVGLLKEIEFNSFGNKAEITYIQIQMCLFQVSSNNTVNTL